MSKVAAEHKTYEQAMAGIDETLKKMGLYGILRRDVLSILAIFLKECGFVSIMQEEWMMM